MADHPPAEARPTLPDGLVVFVKRDCPTCEFVVPALAQLRDAGRELTIYTQDDPGFPEGLAAIDDTSLRFSWHYEVEAVPTLLRVENGRETGRALGWQRDEWEALCDIEDLATELPDWRPGCGSLSVDPDRSAELAARYGGSALRARRVELGASEDEFEAMWNRGWSDGLPLVPPTAERVMGMLEGTSRKPDDVVAVVPPDLVSCTVEKVAINAVMAGCRPEYLPVVIAAVEAVCTDAFNMHGLLATTMGAGPVIVVNGPIAREIGMNSGINALGQGNRANSTIGRAVQLVVRNVGGGRPGEVDRATFGQPGKLSFCFAEDEEGSPWTPLCADLGLASGVNAVTIFPGEGPRTVVDQISRRPESLAKSLAVNMRTVIHPKMAMAFDCLLVVGPEHARVFHEGGWDKAKLQAVLHEELMLPGAELVRGAGGIDEGLPESIRDATLPKFRPGGILVAHAGGRAGLFSLIIGGWVNGEKGSQPVVQEIQP